MNIHIDMNYDINVDNEIDFIICISNMYENKNETKIKIRPIIKMKIKINHRKVIKMLVT